MDSTDSSLDLIRRWVDAVNDRDIDALLAVAHEQILCRPLSLGGGGGTYIGHDGLRRWIGRLSPDLRGKHTAHVPFRVLHRPELAAAHRHPILVSA